MKKGVEIVYDIITMGSATIDVSAQTHSQLVKVISNNDEEDFIAYPSGTKILMNDLNFNVGGGGTNTAVSFSRLGLNTAFLGHIGVDANASLVLEVLNREGISFIGSQEGKTGYSFILDSIEKDRTILTFKGTNDNLKTSDVVFSTLQTKWIYSSSLVGESYQTMKSVFEYAKYNKIKVAFNPSSYQAKLGFEHLKEVILLCDVLVMNKEEIDLLFLHQDYSFESFLQDNSSIYVVVTDGKHGVTCYVNGDVVHISPTLHTNVVETTGAGDAFASGFVCGLIKELSLEDALRLGMVQAESVIQFVGAKEGLLKEDVAFSRLKTFEGKVGQPKQSFTLVNGKELRSIAALVDELKVISDEDFSYHTKNENHFAHWISDVFGLGELAELVRQQKTKEDLYTMLTTYKRGE